MTITQQIQSGINTALAFVKDQIPPGAVVDSELSATSLNAVQNKVLTTKINSIDSDLTDNATAIASEVSRASGAETTLQANITALQTNLEARLDTDETAIEGHTQSITSIENTLSGKQGTLTPDGNTITIDSSDNIAAVTGAVSNNGEHLVKAKDIYTAIANATPNIGGTSPVNVTGTSTKTISVTTDASPTSASTNLLSSGAIYSALSNKVDTAGNGLTKSNTTLAVSFGTIASTNTTKPVTGAAINTSLSTKLDTAGTGLTKTGTTVAIDFGTVDTSNTTKAVTGKAVKDAIDSASPDITSSILAGAGISKTVSSGKVTLSAVLPTSDPGVDNVLYIVS